MERFGDFVLLHRIAQGGMAEVFCAEHPGSPVRLALKRIHAKYADEPEFIDMFIDEANVLAKLRHPNIVEIVDIGLIDGSYFIAMEYVCGRPLNVLLTHIRRQEKTLPFECAAFIAREIARGLASAHQCRDVDGQNLGIIHRDISPPNILISYKGEIKIIDFGIAKAARRVSGTRAGTLKGKFLYMSPEQARGEPIDQSTDIYALGAILHEMVALRQLYRSESDIMTLNLVQQGKADYATTATHGIPAQLERVLKQALTPRVGDRYTSASVMERELTGLLEEVYPDIDDLSECLSMTMYDVFGPPPPDDEAVIYDSQDGTPTLPSRDEIASVSPREQPDTIVALPMLVAAASDEPEFSVQVESENDIVAARRVGREMARTVGMSDAVASSIATVISELARNVVQFASRGRVTIRNTGRLKPGLFIVVCDQGPGIDAVDDVFAGPRRSRRGLGMGLIGVKRLMDEFTIETSRHGTTIAVTKYL